MKKGYNVCCPDDECSVAVVATTSKEAKRLAFPKLDCEWIEVKVKQAKRADVKDLPIGVVNDTILAWRVGIFDWIENYDDTSCEICNKNIALYVYNKKLLCESCYAEAK